MPEQKSWGRKLLEETKKVSNKDLSELERHVNEWDRAATPAVEKHAKTPVATPTKANRPYSVPSTNIGQEYRQQANARHKRQAKQAAKGIGRSDILIDTPVTPSVIGSTPSSTQNSNESGSSRAGKFGAACGVFVVSSLVAAEAFNASNVEFTLVGVAVMALSFAYGKKQITGSR